MKSLFVQIHFLTSYPATLLNRDDAGMAKRIPFGGAVRTRISSQCLKRHWRTSDGADSLSELGVPMSVRSRLSFEKYVFQPLMDGGTKEEVAREVTSALMRRILGQSEKAKKSSDKDKDVPGTLQTAQVTVLGRAELDYARSLAQEICTAVASADRAKVDAAVKERLGREGSKNLQALAKAAGLDAALFGRMVTSDLLSKGDAAVHVAHAFTVHAEASESDYFSAVDDLLREEDVEELGSGHIGNVELTSGLYYGYVVVDVPLLVSNLEGCPRQDWAVADKKLSADVVGRLVRLIATVSPGAKLGSTAPYSYAHCLMVEAGSAQPRTLANAFLKPVAERPDLLANTYAALGSYLKQADEMYGHPSERSLTGIGPIAPLLGALSMERPVTLDALASWAGATVTGK